MMKPFSAVLSALLAASLLLTGCSASGSQESQSSSSQTQEESGSSETETSNPVQPVRTAAELAEMGYDIVLPADAQDIEYSVIDDSLAQALFTISDAEWTLRTSASDEDLSGLYGERTLLSTLEAKAHDGSSVTVQVESVDTGEEIPRLCASWELNGMHYTLSVLTEDETAFREMCTTLIGYLGDDPAAESDSSSSSSAE